LSGEPLRPPSDRVGIAGLGLIGGSIALGLKRQWPGVTILGFDHGPVLDEAARSNVIDERCESFRDLESAGLVVLASPVPAIIDAVREASDAPWQMTITDVGSTKRRIMAAAGSLRGFVGGHPMAGAEHGGFANARADLFEGRPWLVVPGNNPDEDRLAAVEQLARSLGATPHRIDPDTHDRVMAFVSHAPQLISCALMAAAGQGVGEGGLALAGRGLADLTRLASSPSDVWQGILATNADYIAEALDAFTRVLPSTLHEVRDPDRIEQLFAEARMWRDRLLPTHPPVH
jgi:prephenate dehydrogenase